MDSNSLTQLLYCFCVLSAFLLVGVLLRATVPIFRKLFLPASVIGGFIGLLLGPIIWGDFAPIPFPQEWVSTWSELPGLLIVPVVASVPLGMKFAKAKPGGAKSKTSSNIVKMFGIMAGAIILQGIIGMATQAVFRYIGGMDLYSAFGYELPSGFSGGHGTAGAIGLFYKGMDLDYWETAQGVTTTTATFGLIGGMIIGIIAINIAARRGKTAVLKKPGDLPLDMAKGIQFDESKQKSTGRETTVNSSIESFTFHLAIILVGCGIAYGVMNFLKWLNIPILGDIPVWAYAICVMFGLNFLIMKLKLGSLIDTKTKSRISGVCSDFAITAAIASLPVKAVFSYIVPILFMVAVGFVVTFFFISKLCKKVFDDYHTERFIACFGTSSGVFLTGLMLLKIADPDYETPVLNDYSVGYTFSVIASFVLMAVLIPLIVKYNPFINIAIQSAIFAVFMLMIFFANRISKRDKASSK